MYTAGATVLYNVNVNSVSHLFYGNGKEQKIDPDWEEGLENREQNSRFQ